MKQSEQHYRSRLQMLEQELMHRSGLPLPVEPQRFVEALVVVYERLVDIERVEYVSLYRVRRILGIILDLDEIGFNRMLQEVFPKLVSGAIPGYRIALEVDATPRELAAIRRRNWHILIDGIARHITARPTMRATLSHPELPDVSIEIECDLFGEPAERTTSFRMPLLEQLSGAAAAAAPLLIEAAANELRAANALAWRLTDLLQTATTRTIDDEDA